MYIKGTFSYSILIILFILIILLRGVYYGKIIFLFFIFSLVWPIKFPNQFSIPIHDYPSSSPIISSTSISNSSAAKNTNANIINVNSNNILLPIGNASLSSAKFANSYQETKNHKMVIIIPPNSIILTPHNKIFLYQYHSWKKFHLASYHLFDS